MADPSDIVLAAVQAAGPAGSDLRAWRRRVEGMVPAVAALLAPSQYGPVAVAQRVTEAVGFPAELISSEMEETSKRLLIQLRTTPSKRYPEGIEPIRTYPSWSTQGWLQIGAFQQLAPGTRLYIYKAMEDKAGQTDGEQVRVLAHFEVLGAASSQGFSSPTPSADTADVRPGASAPTEGTISPDPSSHPTTPPASDGKAAVEASLEGFTNSQKIRVAKACHAAGLNDWVDPSDEHLDKVLLIITEVRNDKT